MRGWWVVAALPFILGIILSQAIAGGLWTSMRMDLDPHYGSRPFHRDPVFDGMNLIRLYRQRFPAGRKHMQALMAYLMCFGCYAMLGLYIYVCTRMHVLQ